MDVLSESVYTRMKLGSRYIGYLDCMEVRWLVKLAEALSYSFLICLRLCVG
jgi:hypothetical protein